MTPPRAIPRRHDLDALRAIAMLTGVALHSALAYSGLPWPVQDTRQHVAFAWFYLAVHGFRLPLFFLVSGFFTAMLWRKRGLRALVEHRARRVLLPCLLALVTVVPAVNWVSARASGVPRGSAAAGAPAGGLVAQLIDRPVFHHLWFLWYLCWLVAAFALAARVAERAGWRGPPRAAILSPARYLWLVPLTMAPQWFMGELYPSFGPDTSTGVLPALPVLLYYAVFFLFGALYFDCDDGAARVGSRWRLTLPVGLLVLLPFGLAFAMVRPGEPGFVAQPLHRPLAVAIEVSYAWVMSFGLMGLFREMLRRESRVLRYVSDASYWLYLAHVPLIIAAQAIVRDWPLPPVLKLALVCGGVSLLLLLVYETTVRYTWLGTMLNGPRQRAPRVAARAGS